MKLTKQDEKDLMHVYNTWWHSYLNGDVKTYDSYLANDYRFIGSTDNEDYLNRKDTTKFFKDTAEQLAGKAELRNLERTINVIDKDLVLFTDLANAYVLNGSDWVFYSRFRFTSLIKKTKDGWHFTYQHFSAPDNKAQKGETLGTEQISKENQDLRDAIKRRTIELEHSNRELAVEAALERVRARTMAMYKSEELKEVIQVVYEQLLNLNFKIEHAGFIIDYKENDDMHIWLTDKHDVPSKVVLPYFDCAHWNSYKEAKNIGSDFFTNHLDFKTKNKFYKDLFTFIPDVPKETLEYYFSCPGLAISTVLLDNIGLYIENFEGIPYSKKENDTLMRFGNVFQQTYTRFLDLQKAEAQAWEAKIETSLERTRSVAMNIRTSEEVLLVAESMYKELKILGFSNIRNAQIVIDLKENDMYLVCIHSDDTSEIIRESRYETSPIIQQLYDELDTSKDAFYQKELKGTEFNNWLKWRKGISDAVDDQLLKAKSISFYLFSIGEGHIGISAFNTISEEKIEVLQRFRNVFEMTYRRFIDLQKAEAQAREVRIEYALEKVRSRTMAMQKSDELREAGGVLYRELTNLDITSLTIGYVLMDESEKIGWNYTANPADGTIWEFAVGIPHDETDFMRAVKSSWKQQEPFSVIKMDAKQTITHQTFIAEHGINFPYTAEELISFSPEKIVLYSFNFKQGYLMIVGDKELQKKQEEMLVRFTKVFQQTYTRFLDLQKAEEQAREAKIEGALERVRSKTMAMHDSKDLEGIVITLFDELLKLGIDKSMRCGIGILEGHETMETRSVNSNSDGTVELRVGMLNMSIHPMLIGLKKAWKNGIKEYSYEFDSKDLKTYYKALNKEPNYPFNANLNSLPSQEFHRSFFFSSGILFAFSATPISKEASDILGRFASVFGQTYRRFLDLQKAEAQARESQIEAALEKVRSRSLAMHQSSQMQQVANEVYQQMIDIGLEIHVMAMSGVIDNESDYDVWVGNANFDKPLRIPYNNDTKVQRDYNKAIKERPDIFTSTYSGKVMDAYFKHLLANNTLSDEIEKMMLKCSAFTTTLTFMKNSGIQVVRYNDEAFSYEDNSIVKRFGKVFEQAYIRFLDLQKSEAQARESQIEAALERVRSRSMAMHKSEELLEVISVVDEQLHLLNFKFIHVSFANNELGKDYKFWTSSQGMPKPMRFIVPYMKMAVFNNLKKAQEKELTFYTDIITKEEHNQWHEHLLKNGGSDIFSKEENDFIMKRGMARSIAINPNIMLILANYASIPYSEEENKIIARFGKVFEQSYTRFLDLQKAEAQTRETEIELALERIRARTMAMHKSSELGEVAAVLFEQISTLTETPSRFNIAIINEEKKSFDIWLTDQSGKNVNQQFVFHCDKSPVVNEIFNAWKTDKNHLIQDLHGKRLKEWIKYSSTQVGVPFDKSQIKKHRFISSICFQNGFIGITTEVHPEKEEIQLLERFTKVFEQTYTRFLDLEKAEAQAMIAKQNLKNLKTEKKRAEDALTELQHTQKQLIQSEKMASLGELTAGIAHEIQNPLNFVNNFSEVSNELIDEMNDEIEKGDLEEAKYIMADIKSNLVKINHHGKRADAIVKGMLQHSRTSSAEKEPTDINKLADEYLRLAYHGLRAKDKSFNSNLETDYDDSIGKVTVIPQDIGRVILNLITNAFYAVDEKKKLGIANYEPTVTVSTKKSKNKITVSVKDNGNGIPKHVIEKVFQPFFTTKPTGRGTGLGLSMSYDIINKGHGGKILVETEEGEGTEFIIKLPI